MLAAAHDDLYLNSPFGDSPCEKQIHDLPGAASRDCRRVRDGAAKPF
jgi:hypothetical protein